MFYIKRHIRFFESHLLTCDSWSNGTQRPLVDELQMQHDVEALREHAQCEGGVCTVLLWTLK